MVTPVHLIVLFRKGQEIMLHETLHEILYAMLHYSINHWIKPVHLYISDNSLSSLVTMEVVVIHVCSIIFLRSYSLNLEIS